VTGTFGLSTVAAGTYINSAFIDIISAAKQGYFSLWSKVRGDFGQTGSGVSIIWDGCYVSTGVSYVTPTGTSFIRQSGTSKTGPNSNGIDIGSLSPRPLPFIRIKARHSSASATNAAFVDWALSIV